MGLRKKWKPPTPDELTRPVRTSRFVLSETSFWPKFHTLVSWNRKPEVVEAPKPMNVMECQECGSPGSTLCPYHTPGEKNLTDLPIRTKQDLINWWIEYGFQNEERIIPMSETSRPQQDPREGKTSVTDLVLADIEDRRKQGIAKYGTELKTQNGRKALVDLYQELLDAVLYVRQVIEEEREKLDEMGKKVSEQMLEQMEFDFSPKYDAITLTPIPADAKPGTFFPVTVSDMLAPGVVVEYTPRALQSRESILEEAQRLVHGDRGKDYGHPIFDMTRSADMLTALLRDKLRTGLRLEAEDIAQAMICVKQSRERNQPKRDNNTDTAGYAEVKQMLKEWRDAHPGEDPRNHF